MILPNTAGLMLAPTVFFTTISALAIGPDVRTPCPQIYSKKLHSAKIYEALATKKNLRTVTRTVDATAAAAATRLADVHHGLVHDARGYEAFIATKPWKTMTIEQDEVVYVTTTRQAAAAAVESEAVDFVVKVPSGTAAVETDDTNAQSTESLYDRDRSITRETEVSVKTIEHSTTQVVDSTGTHTKIIKHTTTSPTDSNKIHTKSILHTTTTPIDLAKTEIKTTGAKRNAETTQSVGWETRWSEIFVPAPSPTTNDTKTTTGAKKDVEGTKSTSVMDQEAGSSEAFSDIHSAPVTSSFSAAAATTSTAGATTSSPSSFNPDLLPDWYWEMKSSSLALKAAKSSSSAAATTSDRTGDVGAIIKTARPTNTV